MQPLSAGQLVDRYTLNRLSPCPPPRFRPAQGRRAVIALAIVVCWRNDVRFVLIAVVIWQVLWEIGEMVMDRINNDPPHMRDYPFPDGAIDTCMDLIGACIVLWLTRKSRRKAPENMNA